MRSMAVLGLRHEQIAKTLGLRSPKTLRKHFRRELAAGFAEATLGVLHVAYDMATSGRYPQMTIFWDKCRQTLAGRAEGRGQRGEARAGRARTQADSCFSTPKETADAS